MVCEYDFSFCAFFFDQVSIVFNIVHACEGVFDITENTAVVFQCQHVCVRIYAAVIQQIHVEQVVANFVGRIAQHQNNFFRAFCDTAQADCETVSAQDGEYHTDGFAAQFCFYVFSDVCCGSVVTVSSCNNCFCYTDNVFFMQLEAVFLCSCQNGICNDFYDIIALSDDRCFNTSGNSPCHNEIPPTCFHIKIIWDQKQVNL